MPCRLVIGQPSGNRVPRERPVLKPRVGVVSFACLVHANEIMAAVFGYPPERLSFYAAFGRFHCAARRGPVGVATTWSRATASA
jgi:hypothetical protein